ncbi:MAG: SCP2 sterol-binding domain-containing protein [Nevskia sp.]|nr:SCP2 sterol-binding domain-containing protein [Nevskia sp.]
MDAKTLLEKLPAAFQPQAAGGTNAVVQFNCSTPYYAAIKDGACTVTAGIHAGADVTLTMSDEDLVALLTGELNGMSAFMTGKLQLEGDMMLAQRVGSFFDAAKLG